MDKEEIKAAAAEALKEVRAEEQEEMVKAAQRRSDAIELGVRAYIKKAEEKDGKEWSEEDKNLLLQTAAEIDAQG